MQTLDGTLVHSASDLNGFSECVHLSALERSVAAGLLVRPDRSNATAGLLAVKGEQHERHHLEWLQAQFGAGLVAFENRPEPTRAGFEAAERDTVAAMAAGVRVIYQATFFDGTFVGHADFLQRVDRPSLLWPWNYEVLDTKLALSPKPYFLVQLCNYSEHVARIQGTMPEHAAIVLGTGEERRFRVAEYAAYYRQLKSAYLAAMARSDDAYPFECAHCELCPWRDTCAAKRDADDHLSLVANIRRDQIKKLEDAGIGRLGALATASDEQRPKRLRDETFEVLRAQAAEQHRYRQACALDGKASHSYTFRPSGEPGCGLSRLPEPAPGDIFFDMEGDPLYRPDRGLEYLFGVYLPDGNTHRPDGATYIPFWGTTLADERRAFEEFVDFVVVRRRKFPNLHVYHYAPYETTALKRLMGEFASREFEIDDFLRGGLFIDLFPVVRQTVWISQPSYSIKKVEALYDFTRVTQTKGGDDSIVMFESWLESQDPATLEDIRAYNEDDCRSTFVLREWLVTLRAERNAQLATPIAWRPAVHAAPPVEHVERTALEASLLEGIAAPESMPALRMRPEAERARWLLGNLMQYHRRDQKPEWWEYYQRFEDQTDLIEGDRKALGGLEYCPEIPPFKYKNGDHNLVYTFTYPEQEHDVGSNAVDPVTRITNCSVVAFDDAARRAQIKLPKTIDPQKLRALVPAAPISVRDKSAVMASIAGSYHAGLLERDYPATRDLLLGLPPRLRNRSRGGRIQPHCVSPHAVSELVRALDGSYLIVQGPPGSGKSTTGAHVVLDLLTEGKRVALAAQSHKALHNLLSKVEETARSRGVTFRGCHKSSKTSKGSQYVPCGTPSFITDAPSSSHYEGCALVSGTTFAWAAADQAGQFDVVVIDEAGQISLADALLISRIARKVVLLGDPQQLPQVSHGTHPVGTGLSILEHLLGEDATVRENRGVFLDVSYRLQPAIANFVSTTFYDGRLHADALNANNAVVIAGGASGGLRFAAIEHEANQRRSVEEAVRVVDEIAGLLEVGVGALHRDLRARRLTQSDILVVTPYNAQRSEIEQRLQHRGFPDIRVGTVDKFQGQEAPVVFYSLATSSAELAPRGIDFLLSPNRINVAVSRAQALVTVVCSPGLLSSRASKVEDMRLLNLLCAYVEAAGSSSNGLVSPYNETADPQASYEVVGTR